MEELQAKFSVSERPAGRVLDQPRRRSDLWAAKDDDARLTKKIMSMLVSDYVGLPANYTVTARSNEHINVKRVYRLWKAAGLKVHENGV